MKVCAFVASVEAGGAERVMSALSHHWAAAGHTVCVVTLTSPGADEYVLHPQVQRVGLALMNESRSRAHGVWQNLRRIGAFRRVVRAQRPDVVISFHPQLNVLALLACIGQHTPVIVSERVHPPAHTIGARWEYLRRMTYPFASAVVVQTEEARRWAVSVARPNRVHVIPNAVNHPFVRPAGTAEETRLPVVLGLGRLVTQKGFDVLLKAFATVAERHPEWSLTIVGEGPEGDSLKALAADLSLRLRVVFAGRVPDPERHYRNAGLFVLSSRFEGFPNALLEAMATGCPVIATDCLAGPAEIVRDGVDGVLVPPDNVAALAQALDRLMADARTRAAIGARAREVAGRFHPDRIMALWDRVIRQARA